MERSEQHEIDEAAQRVLKNALPVGWILRTQIPDYGIDYRLEIVEARQLTGLNIAIQLRGKNSLKLKGEAFPFSVEKRHLKYYLDKCRDAVFLVVADTKNSESYWLFLQGYLLDKLKDKDWRSQTWVTVHVPISQKVSDNASFVRAAQEAERRMGGLRPASIENAIASVRQRMESLDPRFEIHIKSDGKSHSFQALAREPVNVSLIFKGKEEEALKKKDDLFGRGVPVTIAPNEVEVRGPPLFAEQFKETVTLQFARRQDVHLRLCVLNAENQEVASIDAIPARSESGMREFRLRGALPLSPLIFDFTATMENGTLKFPNCGVTLALTKWAGQKVRHLAYFDPIHRFLKELTKDGRLRFSISRHGNQLCSVPVTITELEGMKETVWALDKINKAREIAEWLKVNPKLPAETTGQELANFDRLHWELASGEKRTPGTGLEIEMKIGVEGLKQLLEKQDSALKGGELKVIREPATLIFFGQDVPLGKIEYILTRAKLKESIEDLKRQLDSNPTGAVSITWIGDEGAEYVVRR